MFQGKMKALTFSYDDGVLQDIRLIELFNKYGMKATFNLNYECLGQEGTVTVLGQPIAHTKVAPQDVRRLYEGHEIAGHTLTHPHLYDLSDEALVREVEEDRLRLSELAGYEVVGFAYPYGDCDARISRLLRERTGIRYARTVSANYGFDPQTELYTFSPTLHHADKVGLLSVGERFLAAPADKPQILYVWGHSYEFDLPGAWEDFERFLALMAGRADIFYGTNREVLL